MKKQIFCNNIILIFSLCISAFCSVPSDYYNPALEQYLFNAEEIDLVTTDVDSVVKLREIVKIPPPTTKIKVKYVERDKIPNEIKQFFPTEKIHGVTIAGKYVIVIKSGMQKLDYDILQHELVHAYITLASPKILPFWFQEGSAVHFSIDSGSKFYGKPDENNIGAVVGGTINLTDEYKQKLQSFHFLIQQLGEEKFYEWYRNAVMTGNTDAREVLGLSRGKQNNNRKYYNNKIGVLAAVMGITILLTSIASYIYLKKSNEKN
ncbi:MAG: hypothetical protein SNJ70_01440 [Armatimonadota bacterium]